MTSQLELPGARPEKSKKPEDTRHHPSSSPHASALAAVRPALAANLQLMHSPLQQHMRASFSEPSAVSPSALAKQPTSSSVEYEDKKQRLSDESKVQSAYRTISEVADELGVPQHVLRFWEAQFPQVRPSRMRGGRRYYRPEDIELLKKIKTLLYAQGYTIKGAKKLVRSKDFLQQRFEVSAETGEVVQSHAPAPHAPSLSEQHTAAPVEPKIDVKSLASELRVLKSMLATIT